MAKPKIVADLDFTTAQISGYEGLLSGEILGNCDGAYVTIDIRTATALRKICRQLKRKINATGNGAQT